MIFCFGWSRLIKPPLLELPPMGVVGFHPAALPKNRGRHPLIRALVLGLRETASETNFGIDPRDTGFKPNVFVDISGLLKKKLELMKIYASEMGGFPFPRSEKALRALAQLRGS